MSINIPDSIEALQDLMDECCERHDQCLHCAHLESCRNIWDKVSEYSYAKPLPVETLRTSLNEFYRLWQEDEIRDPAENM
jgi:antitoxin component HigA of HigAB toxin-antitoxin module